MKRILITHDDLDGAGCAIVFKWKYPDIEIQHHDYKTIDAIAEELWRDRSDYDQIFFADISPSEELGSLMLDYPKFVIIDHHKTREYLAGSPHFDVGTSGTMLSYDFLWSKPFPKFVRGVNAWDIWDLESPFRSLGKDLNLLFGYYGMDAFVDEFKGMVAMPEFHILVIPSWYPTAYSNIRGIFFKEQVHALSKNRIRVGVVYPDLRSMRTFSIRALKENYFQTTVQTEDGIPTIRYHGWSIPKMDKIRGARFIKLSERLATKYIRKYDKPDIIHAHSILWGGCAAQHLHERFQIPYFITEHSSVYMQNMIKGFQEPFIRKTIRDAHTVIAVSSSLADLIAPYAGGKEIDVIPNTIDTGYFSLPVHPRITKPFRFLTVAMLTPKKNVDTLIQAFARSFRGQEDVQLEIGGDGTQRTSLEKLVTKERLDSQIHFLGMLTRHQVRQAMWRANCFVLPSQVETFGVVLIEGCSRFSSRFWAVLSLHI